jgi:uroporphyrinogen decarboxylase
MLMELGVDILNPLQATANDLDKVRSVTRGRMALHGGVSSAAVMSGPVELIDADVRRRIDQLGGEGGYFCDVDQDLPFPETHKQALDMAIEKYG